jgi:phage-related protein
MTTARNLLRMPQSRALGNGLFELRFTCEDVARRITYTFEPDRKVFTLTTFRKQRQNEQREIDRARTAQASPRPSSLDAWAPTRV